MLSYVPKMNNKHSEHQTPQDRKQQTNELSCTAQTQVGLKGMHDQQGEFSSFDSTDVYKSESNGYRATETSNTRSCI